MNINKYNYEEYALDFLEGNLSSEMKDAFQKFLDKNPEIKEEIQSLEIAPIGPEQLGEVPFFNRKEELYREAAVISMLKKPVQFKLWQVAAALIMLLSSVWVLNSYYTNSGEVIQIAMEDSERIPSPDVLAETGEANTASTPADGGLEAVEKKDMGTAGTKGEKKIQNIPTERIEMAGGDSDKDKVIADVEMSGEEALVQESVAEEWTDLNPREIDNEMNEKEDVRQAVVSSLLPSKMTKLDFFSGDLDRGFESPYSQNSLDKEEVTNRGVESLFAKLVDRVIPSTYSGRTLEMDFPTHKDRIPVALLPEIIQQQ